MLLKKLREGGMKSVPEKLSLPPEAFASPRLTLTEGRLYIEGRIVVEQYGREVISARCGNRLVTVSGARLEIGAMSRDEILITGDIRSVETLPRGRRK